MSIEFSAAGYECYWFSVLGVKNAAGIVSEFDLDASDRHGLDEWLSLAEVEAARADGISPIPAEWAEYHARALDELCSVEMEVS